MLVWFVLLIYVFLIGFNGSVDGDLGVACPGTPCVPGNHEICDTVNTNNCICEAGYTAGTTDVTTCFQAIDLNSPCAAHDECLLGNGGPSSICSTNCVCDTGYTENAGTCQKATDLNSACGSTPECTLGNGGAGAICSTNCACDASNDYTEDSSTCKKDCGNPSASAGYVPEMTPSSTLEAATATVQCEAGYTGTAATITCEASGSWSAFSGCTSTATDLNNACSVDAECELGNGGANSGCSTNCVCDMGYIENGGTCMKATDLNNACGSTPECTLGNGGAGAICSTNCVCDASNDYTEDSSTCKKDCGDRPSEDGYEPEVSPASTLQGAVVSVNCAKGYTGTAAQITCEASGSWSTYSGCSGGNRTKLDFSLVTVLAVLLLGLI